MRSYRRALLCSLLAVLMCGCSSLWHELQPHRMRRINSGPAPSWDPEFSRIAPPVDTQFVRRGQSKKPSIVTANSAEPIVVRGQSAD